MSKSKPIAKVHVPTDEQDPFQHDLEKCLKKPGVKILGTSRRDP